MCVCVGVEMSFSVLVCTCISLHALMSLCVHLSVRVLVCLSASDSFSLISGATHLFVHFNQFLSQKT